MGRKENWKVCWEEREKEIKSLFLYYTALIYLYNENNITTQYNATSISNQYNNFHSHLSNLKKKVLLMLYLLINHMINQNTVAKMESLKSRISCDVLIKRSLRCRRPGAAQSFCSLYRLQFTNLLINNSQCDQKSSN